MFYMPLKAGFRLPMLSLPARLRAISLAKKAFKFSVGLVGGGVISYVLYTWSPSQEGIDASIRAGTKEVVAKIETSAATANAQIRTEFDRGSTAIREFGDQLAAGQDRILQKLETIRPGAAITASPPMEAPRADHVAALPPASARRVRIPWRDGGRPAFADLTVSASEQRIEARLLDLLRGELALDSSQTAPGPPIARIALNVVYETAEPTASCQWPRRFAVNGQVTQAGQPPSSVPDFVETACLAGAPTEDAVKEDLAKRVARRAALKLMARPLAGL